MLRILVTFAVGLFGWAGEGHAQSVPNTPECRRYLNYARSAGAVGTLGPLTQLYNACMSSAGRSGTGYQPPSYKPPPVYQRPRCQSGFYLSGRVCVKNGEIRCGNSRKSCPRGQKCWTMPSGIPPLSGWRRGQISCMLPHEIGILNDQVAAAWIKQREERAQRRREKAERRKEARRIAKQKKREAQRKAEENRQANLRKTKSEVEEEYEAGKDAGNSQIKRIIKDNTENQRKSVQASYVEKIQNLNAAYSKDCPTVIQALVTARSMCDKDISQVVKEDLRKSKKRVAYEGKQEKIERETKRRQEDAFWNGIPTLPSYRRKQDNSFPVDAAVRAATANFYTKTETFDKKCKLPTVRPTFEAVDSGKSMFGLRRMIATCYRKESCQKKWGLDECVLVSEKCDPCRPR